MSDPKTYDLLLDWDPKLSFPRLLDSPWWWIVSGLVVAIALALLEALDRAKKRRFQDA